MNTIERGAAVISVLVVVFGAGIAWDSLSNRIEKVDAKISEIQKTLGSTPCSAILDRQLAAIDKGRADVRKALDGLSTQYGCLANRNDWAVATADDSETEQVNTVAAATSRDKPGVEASNLRQQLNAVDAVLNNRG